MTPASRHEVIEGRIGSAIDGECTTDSAGVRASAVPLTAAIRVTRHAPLCPPRNTVNMAGMEARNRTRFKLSAVIPGREANPESRDSGFDAAHRPQVSNCAPGNDGGRVL